MWDKCEMTSWDLEIKGQGKVKGKKKTVFTFVAIGSVRRAAKSSNSQRVKVNIQKILREYKGHTWKGQGQGQVTKGHQKIKVTRIPCDICFWVILHVDIDSVGHLTLWRHQSLLLTEGQDQVKRSSFPINIFA